MPRRTHIGAIAVSGLLLALQGCSDDVPTSAATNPERSSSQAIAQDQPVEWLARGIAGALAEPAVRQQILEDLRDSPFSKHGIHLRSYLRGKRGKAIVAAAAPAAGMEPKQFLAAIDDLPKLQLLMPRSLDRVGWTGTDDVVVVATAAPLPQIAVQDSFTGYTPYGEAVGFRVSAIPNFPMIFVMPMDKDKAKEFGDDPEAKRKGIPKQSRKTVSTREEEISPTYIEPDPCDTDPDCRSGGGSGSPTGYRLSTESVWSTCISVSSTTDRDRDGLRDACEYEVAHAFSPRLMM